MNRYSILRLLRIFFIFISIFLVSNLTKGSLLVDIDDASGDVSNTNIDITKVTVSNSNIDIEFFDADFSTGSYIIVILFDDNLDSSNWEAGIILRLVDGYSSIFWTLSDVKTSNTWSDNPGSNVLDFQNKISLSFNEYQNLGGAEVAVISFIDSTVNQIDYAPNFESIYWSYADLQILVSQAMTISYSNNNPGPITTSTSDQTDPSLSTTNGFEFSIVVLPLFFFLIKKRNK